MSGKGSGGHKAGIPPASRKMVQSLREIVSNIPEHEIYATLKDCNMDPNEAVSRLLSQDPFHEVKSKREKKKEIKDTTDSRPRGTSITSSRGGGSGGGGARVGADRYVGRGGGTQFSSSGDSGLLQGKSVLKKENGMNAYGGFTASASSALDNNVNRQLPSYSDSVRICDGLSSSQHGGLQSVWVVNPGQVSMADIVRMGRPQAKASMPNPSLHSGNHQNAFAPPTASQHNLHSLQGYASKVSETNNDQGFAINSNDEQNDEWPSIENQPAVCVSSVVDCHPTSEYHTNSSNSGEANQQLKTNINEFVAEDDPIENPDNVGSASISVKSISEENPESTSVFDGSLYNDINAYQPHRHPFENDEVEGGVSSVAANLEQLSLHTNDQETEQEENSSVVIPNHLQLHSPECLNLSFGSFGSANDAALSGSGPYVSRPLKSNLEDTSGATDVSTIGSKDAIARNPDYYGDEHLTTTSDGNLSRITGVDAGTYEHSSSISQPEALKSELPETTQENQYSFPSSSHEFTYENAQQTDVTYPHSQTSSQIPNLSPFSSVMAYTNSLPNALLASTVQTAREDIPYSPFPATQSMPAKYSNIASSIGGPTITMSEALRANNISTPQPNPQALPSANVATGPALPQHLAVHPYSQPTLPLGHFANMISYPFLPQSYTYMPSAFQQAFAGNSTYHQSLAAMLPQYKNSISVSSLPQSAAVASGYGFGSSTSIPGGNYPLNPPVAPTSTTIGYDDVINSQYKDNNHMISLQNENSPMWVHGPSSRTMSAVPPSTYYSFQGQNQQPGGFRQSQQPSQHFGSLGYPNFYHSQTGISLEHQQQNPREASLAGSQNQPPKQSQQIWQNSY
ncbi:GBF-interacting protein 1 [Mucuna pruriens]|uniref:GBF-interacting protein 1 n=1 Tax=Mucuna pruriens TaxID=157652 RepID=A0A371EIZ8_MUCPR|nr:GBF-interacting protein 1 [Mucuna pruriens]